MSFSDQVMHRSEDSNAHSAGASTSARPPIELSVVIPAFTEEGAISRPVAEVHDALTSLSIDFETIVVDDGSSDGARDAAEKSGPRVYTLRRSQCRSLPPHAD